MRLVNNKKISFSGCAILDRLLKILWLAAFLIIPIFFATFFRTYHIFDLNKVILFRIILALVFLLTTVREILYPSNLLTNLIKFLKKYWLGPSAFIILLGISLIFSENITLSFFGSIDRQQGYLGYLFYFFWFVLFSFNLAIFKERSQETAEINKNQPNSFKRFLKQLTITAVISGALASIYGLIQLAGLDPYTWTESAFLNKHASSTLGNANFFASWLLLIIPAAFYLFCAAKKPAIKFLYLLLFLLNLAGLFSSNSRGGLLAVLFAAGLFFLYRLFSGGYPLKKKIAAVFLFIFLSLSFLFIFNQVVVEKMSGLFDFRGGTINARFNFYSAAATAIKEKPLWGYGQDNLTSVFISYYRPEWGIFNTVGQVPDRAHNLFLDILLSGGLSALFAFSILYFSFFRLASKNTHNKNHDNLSLALALGVAAYLFSLLFAFSIPAGEIYFFSFLAILVGIDFSKSSEISGKPKEAAGEEKPAGELKDELFWEKLGSYIILIVVLFLSGWLISKSAKLILADHYFAKAVLAWKEEKYLPSLKLFEQIDDLQINEINRTFYDSYSINAILDAGADISDPVLKQIFMERLLKLSWSLPEKEPYALIAKAKAKLAAGDLPGAEKLLNELEKKAPFWPGIYIEKAKLNIFKGNKAEAIRYFNLALADIPDDKDSRLTADHRENIIKFRQAILYYLAELEK